MPKRLQELSQKFKSLNFHDTGSTTIGIGQYYDATNLNIGDAVIGLGNTITIIGSTIIRKADKI